MRRVALMLAAGLSALAADVNTFSIVGYDPATGDLGVAVASRYFAVGSVVPWAEAGVGVVATQANVNVAYGPRGLELLRQGMPARDVLAKLLAEDSSPPTTGRQVAIIDRKGNIAVYTGPNAPKWAGDRRGATWSAQGNTVDPKVPEAMGKAFEATQGELAEKLFAALKAGADAGGDTRGKQSASMLVVRKNGGRNLNNDRYVSINVDDNPAPIAELRRLLDLNLGLLYSEKAGSMLMAGKSREARDNASRAAHYRPEGHSYFLVATMDYSLGEKDAAIADFRKALKLDPALRQRLQAPPDSVPPGAGFMGRALREILVDKTFLDQALRP